MSKWTLEVYEDHLIIRGAIPSWDLVKIINSFCSTFWVADMKLAAIHDCTFFFCDKDYEPRDEHEA